MGLPIHVEDVRRQVARGKERKTKTRKSRLVDLSSTLARELQALWKERQEKALEAGKNEIPDLVFVNQAGQPVDMNNYRNRVFLKACDEAKIRRRRLHDTRHTFASLLLNNGESLKYVSSQLGHASIRMTADVYGHLEAGANRQAVDRLSSIADTGKGKAATA